MYSNKTIIIISILIPVVVAGLFQVKIEGYDFSILPHIYAPINGLTAMILPLAVYQIRKGNRKNHEYLMKSALILSVIFLILYITYHATTEETKFGGEGTIRIVYFFLLVTHILLSIVIIPLVLNTYFKAVKGDFVRHKKWGKITFYLWEYVALSGVLVYLLIRPYYAA